MIPSFLYLLCHIFNLFFFLGDFPISSCNANFEVFLSVLTSLVLSWSLNVPLRSLLFLFYRCNIFYFYGGFCCLDFSSSLPWPCFPGVLFFCWFWSLSCIVQAGLPCPVILGCEFILKSRKLKTDHQKLPACGQGMWTGESYPGDWAGSGCHSRIPESASEVSSPRHVSFSKEHPPVSCLGESRAASFQRPYRGMGKKGVSLMGTWPFPLPLVSGLTPPSIQTPVLKFKALSTIFI